MRSKSKRQSRRLGKRKRDCSPQTPEYSVEDQVRFGASSRQAAVNELSRKRWTPAEDDMLRVIVMEDQNRSWNKIAEALNETVPNCSHTGKQCYNRWSKVLSR